MPGKGGQVYSKGKWVPAKGGGGFSDPGAGTDATVVGMLAGKPVVWEGTPPNVTAAEEGKWTKDVLETLATGNATIAQRSKVVAYIGKQLTPTGSETGGGVTRQYLRRGITVPTSGGAVVFSRRGAERLRDAINEALPTALRKL